MSRLAASTIAVICLALAACGKDRGCTETGGTIVTLQCCQSAPDFPNTCAIGACGCNPADSVPRQVCQCHGNECFDGERCVPR